MNIILLIYNFTKNTYNIYFCRGYFFYQIWGGTALIDLLTIDNEQISIVTQCNKKSDK